MTTDTRNCSPDHLMEAFRIPTPSDIMTGKMERITRDLADAETALASGRELDAFRLINDFRMVLASHRKMADSLTTMETAFSSQTHEITRQSAHIDKLTAQQDALHPLRAQRDNAKAALSKLREERDSAVRMAKATQIAFDHNAREISRLRTSARPTSDTVAPAIADEMSALASQLTNVTKSLDAAGIASVGGDILTRSARRIQELDAKAQRSRVEADEANQQRRKCLQELAAAKEIITEVHTMLDMFNVKRCATLKDRVALLAIRSPADLKGYEAKIMIAGTSTGPHLHV